ncbi:hypothetical protein, partial [Paracoccus sp. (in: a-proteobacteria)]|uniref:hypothetical protein n=1 Tax=Paracoccus sp. TaxID=267 RepID=UPI00321FAD6B
NALILHMLDTQAGSKCPRNCRTSGVKDQTRLVKRGDRGIVVHGVSLLREVLAGFDTRHDTPPSQAPSPIFSHSPDGGLAKR